MICHHVHDPIKTWRSEQIRTSGNTTVTDVSKLTINSTILVDTSRSNRNIFIGYCSSGTVALKLCKRLTNRLLDAASTAHYFGEIMSPQSLNASVKTNFNQDDVFVIIARNTKKGV
jgi:hypothetical protein